MNTKAIAQASALVLLCACGGTTNTSTSTTTPVQAAEAYPMCTGQAGIGTAGPRTGEMQTQLAPAFLDEMNACNALDIAPPAEHVTSRAGTVNAKGDCAWDNGVSCHYHLGVEFVRSGAERPQTGEIHCIFPSTDDAKSPEVFGGHFTCAGVEAEHSPSTEHGEHTVHEGTACGAGLLPALSVALSSCSSVRCCDDGTLTSATEQRTANGTLDVRPDFHICESTMELDCEALAQLTGHSANAPTYGAPIEDDFALPSATAHH